MPRLDMGPSRNRSKLLVLLRRIPNFQMKMPCLPFNVHKPKRPETRMFNDEMSCVGYMSRVGNLSCSDHNVISQICGPSPEGSLAA